MTTLTRHIKAWFATGPRGERVAARYLRRKGYRIVGRNVRLRAGEIDLVVQDPDQRTLVIVEVKTAALTRPNPKRAELRPEVHVGAAKKRKLASLASLLVQKHHLTDRPIRFDVVGVDLPKGSRPIVRHHIAAFESHL